MSESQRIIKGLPAADGIAVGTAIILPGLPATIEDICLDPSREYSMDDFHRAVRETQRQLVQFQHRLQERLKEPVADIFRAHCVILEDKQFADRVQKRIDSGDRLPASITEVMNEYIGVLSQSNNLLVQEKVDDLNDLSRRLLNNLVHPSTTDVENDYRGQIIVTSHLLPSDILRFAAQSAEGVVLTAGGITAHISVLARCLEVPMILVESALLEGLTSGTRLLMDAHQGMIYLDPDPHIVSSYENLFEAQKKAALNMAEVSPQTFTRDGCQICLLASIGLIREIEIARELRAEGIGLYRSEIPFLISKTFPSEEEQLFIYRKIVEEMKEGEIVFRTLDIGGDKMLSYSPFGDQSNPFLGIRGIRFLFQQREIFCTQIRAMLRAGYDKPVKIMFPLVSSVDSFLHARNIVLDCIRDLECQHIPHHSRPEIGVMIELPSAVGVAVELARVADFFSIGSNDLVQYILAVDRTNQHISNWYVPWHPAVLRAIKTVVDAAKQHQKPVSVCGDMAVDQKLLPVLIGLGVTSFSVSPRRLPQIQLHIQTIDSKEAEKLAAKIITVGRLSEIARLLEISFPSY